MPSMVPPTQRSGQHLCLGSAASQPSRSLHRQLGSNAAAAAEVTAMVQQLHAGLSCCGGSGRQRVPPALPGLLRTLGANIALRYDRGLPA